MLENIDPIAFVIAAYLLLHGPRLLKGHGENSREPTAEKEEAERRRLEEQARLEFIERYDRQILSFTKDSTPDDALALLNQCHRNDTTWADTTRDLFSLFHIGRNAALEAIKSGTLVPGESAYESLLRDVNDLTRRFRDRFEALCYAIAIREPEGCETIVRAKIHQLLEECRGLSEEMLHGNWQYEGCFLNVKHSDRCELEWRRVVNAIEKLKQQTPYYDAG